MRAPEYRRAAQAGGPRAGLGSPAGPPQSPARLRAAMEELRRATPCRKAGSDRLSCFAAAWARAASGARTAPSAAMRGRCGCREEEGEVEVEVRLQERPEAIERRRHGGSAGARGAVSARVEDRDVELPLPPAMVEPAIREHLRKLDKVNVAVVVRVGAAERDGGVEARVERLVRAARSSSGVMTPLESGQSP